MAKSKFVEKWQERRAAERQRQREEEQRRSALERKREEQRELQREDERLEERRREARELDASLNARRAARDALLARYRARRREEKRTFALKVQQHAALLEALREAARERTKSERAQGPAPERSEPPARAKKETARPSPVKKVDQGQPKKRREKRATDERSIKTKARETVPDKSERDDGTASTRGKNGNLREQSRAMRKAADNEHERGVRRRRAAQDIRRSHAKQLARQNETRDEARHRERQRKIEDAHARNEDDRRRRSREMRAENEQPRSRAATRDLPPTTPELPERSARGGDRPKPVAETGILRGRFPSGSLSGDLPWLRVSANSLTSLEGAPVILHGVSLLELNNPVSTVPRFAAAAAIGASSIDAMLAWRPSVIRLAITRTRVLQSSVGNSGLDYLEELDQLIEQAAASGAYTMLSLRRLDDDTAFGTTMGAAGEEKPNFLAPQPDYDAIGMWRILGERYADEPAVLYDLYSTPHPALADDLTGMYSEWDLWRLWTRLAIADLRRVHPRALCFVAGLDWATDLSGFPLLGTDEQPIANLVYAVHMHPRRLVEMPRLRALARNHPVFVTEWSAADTEVGWGERMATLLQSERIGWTAAHWTGDTPLCTAGRRGEPVPTRFGSIVRRSLAMAR